MQDIYDILAKHFAGETSPEEESQITAWKLENQEEYDSLSEMWDVTPDAIHKDFPVKTYDHVAALNKIEPQLNASTPKETKVFRLNNVFKYAAAASIVLLLGLGAIWMMTQNELINVTNDTNTAMEVDLPDGSTVWLAANSSIDYSENFEENRHIDLKGEAFFEVTPDTIFPFSVGTNHGDVTVLGTAFNVEVSENETEVSVDHGKVAFEHNGKEIKLTKGQSASSTKDGVSGIVEADDNYLSWKTGEFHFDQTPLREVIELMNEFYQDEIICENVSKLDEQMNGDFVHEEVNVLIDAIVLTCGVEAEYGEGTIRLK